LSEAPVQLRATYRLQLTARFGFADARALIPYLRDLGISHLYLSPVLQARAGSLHGYDVTDPRTISAELGGEQQFRHLAQSAHDAGMGIVLDVVPNHMATDPTNPFWTDPTRRERFFDIDPATGRHRRFFDIGDLAGVRQEDPEVFEETHAFVLSLVRDGIVDGLRIDHPDGLADPAGYLVRLQERGAQAVWVEKILHPGERLRDWPIAGTVGYEFLTDTSALFIDPAGEDRLTELWRRISGDQRGFGEVALEAKLEQVRGPFRPEVERLERELRDAAVGGREAIELALASLPVYRTYVDAGRGVLAPQDRAAIAAAAPHMPAEIAALLLLERAAPPAFVTRFQQTTPAVMAKGVEDTALYRYGRLLALNDVGGDPSRFGIDVARFHAANLERAERFPLNMLTTQTHDAKRSADVRARIGALASVADEWADAVGRWFDATDGLCSDGAPDDVERYFILQTLAGAWPIPIERLESYMEKALREAKRNTSWIEQNHEWEEAVKQFCRELYRHRPFTTELERFVARLGTVARRAIYGQVALKVTAPGVPDIYQGDELPFRTLVDPDNRRPVDWRWRQAMLRRLMGGSPPDFETYKLFLVLRLLGLRARRPEPFAGDYRPLDAGERVCAYLRGDDVLVAVAVRDGAADETIESPGGRWRDVLTGEERSFGRRIRLGPLLGERGVAVFERLSA
jgi:(1->4)-alpha-D-glucan 1-alpha-D-glucosylmutase